MEAGGLAEETLRNAIKSQEPAGLSRELSRTTRRSGCLGGCENGDSGGVGVCVCGGGVDEVITGLRIYSLDHPTF